MEEICVAMSCVEVMIYKVKIESWVGNLLQVENVTNGLRVFHFYES